MDMRTACVGCRQKRASSASACMSTTDAECAALLPLAPTRSVQAPGPRLRDVRAIAGSELAGMQQLAPRAVRDCSSPVQRRGGICGLPGDSRRQAASSANDRAADAVQVAAEAMQQAQLHMHC